MLGDFILPDTTGLNKLAVFSIPGRAAGEWNPIHIVTTANNNGQLNPYNAKNSFVQKCQGKLTPGFLKFIWLQPIHFQNLSKKQRGKKRKKRKKAEGTFRLGSAKPDMLEIRERDSEGSLCPLRGMGVDGWGGEWEMACLFGDFELILLCSTLVRWSFAFWVTSPLDAPGWWQFCV